MEEKIAGRSIKSPGFIDLGNVLATELSGSQLHSLLLGVFKRRVHDMQPSALVAQNAVTRPCDLDGRLLNAVERLAYDAAANFESIELSPLSPLGAVSVLAKLDLGNVLSTIRAFECASDPTIGMALECAKRRKDQSRRLVMDRLCTNQRVVRFPVPDKPGFTAHFKLFSLVSAGRDGGSFTFESLSLREHIDSYLSLLMSLSVPLKSQSQLTSVFGFEKIVVEISHTSLVEHLCKKFEVDRDEIRANVRARDASSTAKIMEQYKISWPADTTDPVQDLLDCELPAHLLTQLKIILQEVTKPLAKKFPQVVFRFNLHRLTGLGYYQGPCFHLKAQNAIGETYMLADGGSVDWTRTLLSDQKERLMTSAIGTEMLCRMFRC